MKSKILFLGRFAPPTHGAAKMNELYFNELRKDKNFIADKIRINKYDSLEKIGVISFSKFKGYMETYLEIISKIIKLNPDIVYLEIAPKGLAFLKDSVYILISKFFRKKIVVHFHAKGAKKSSSGKISKKYYKFIFKNVKIIVLSKILIKDVKNFANENQIEVIGNGIVDEIADKEFKKIIEKRKKNKCLEIIFLSNMIESKGPIDVLKICRELKNNRIKFNCNFIGNFQEEKFKEKFNKKIKEFKLEEKCNYLGPKYGKEKGDLLKIADILIFPTKYPEETFGLVIIEAFMYGIPVYSYNNASIPEIISKDFLGYVSRKSSWKELSIKIKEDMNKKIEYKKIREYFKSNYTLEDSVDKLKSTLKK